MHPGSLVHTPTIQHYDSQGLAFPFPTPGQSSQMPPDMPASMIMPGNQHTAVGPAPYFPHLAFSPDPGPALAPPPPTGSSEAPPAEQPAPETATAETSRPRRRSTRRKESAAKGGGDAEGEDLPQPISKPKRAPRKKAKLQVTTDTEDAESAPAAKPRRRRAWSARTVDENADATGAESEVSTSAPPRKRKRLPSASSSTATSGTRKGRKKAPTPLPFDVDADPGDEPDPTMMSMADLVADTGRGRVSSKAAEVVNNHASWKAASKAKRVAMRAKAEAKKYGRPEDEENEGGQDGAGMKDGASEARAPDEEVIPDPEAQDGGGAEEDVEEPADEGGFDYSQNMKTSKFAVQVRIGPNGETIVDEQSLFVDRNEEEDETAGYTQIEESDLTKFVNSMTYTKKTNGSRWSAEETEMFYDVSFFTTWPNQSLTPYRLCGNSGKITS
jgi:transcription factor TFIIIB component B''